MRTAFYFIVIMYFSAVNNIFAAPHKLNLKTAAKKTMGYTMKRQEIIAENISAQDVPGYHAKDLKPMNFNNSNSNRISMSTTNSGHFATRINKNPNYRVTQDPYDTKTSKMNNNVDISTQMVKSSENMNQYNLASTIYKQVTRLQKISLGEQ